MTRGSRSALAAALVATIPMVLGAASRSTGRPAGPVAIHYERADIRQVVSEIALASDTHFAFGEELSGQVTITVPVRVSRAEALEVLNVALYMRGFTALPPIAGVRKIVPIAQARGSAPMVGRTPRAAGEEQVTTLVRLHAGDAASLAKTIQNLIPKTGLVLPYPPTNALIMEGSESQLARLIGVIGLIDRAADRDLMVRAIRYRSADSVVRSIEQVVEASETKNLRPRLFSDERTNTLIAMANPEQLEAIRRLVDKIDRPSLGGGVLQVVPIRNRDPEEIAKAIESLRAGQAKGYGGRGSVASPASLGGELTGRDMDVVVDAHSRSLVIRSDRETFRLISKVIAALDVLPPRVSVEMIVLEVRRPSSLKLGVDFFLPLTSPKRPDDFVAFMQSNPGGGGIPQQPSTGTRFFSKFARAPLMLNYVDSAGNLVTAEIPREDVVFQADERRVETHVLLRPQIVVTSGDEQEIFSGDNIPVPVQSARPVAQPAPVAPAGAATPLDPLLPASTIRQTIERQDVGVRLRLTPTVHEGDTVRLDLHLEVSGLGPALAGSGERVGPTIQKRSINAKINLDPGEYAVIGTGTDRRQSSSRVGTPFLMEIPLIGHLLSHVEKSWVDTDLLVVASARILRSPSDDVAETIRRRLAFERDLARTRAIGRLADRPYAVLLESRRSEAEIRTIAEAFAHDGFEPSVTQWELHGQSQWDVYLTGFGSFVEASKVARRLSDAGWSPEIRVLTKGDESAAD